MTRRRCKSTGKAAAVPTTGIRRPTIDGIARSSRQGDRRFFDLLEAMGAEVRWNEEGARVSAGAALSAIVADLGDIPDQVPTLAALAPFFKDGAMTWVTWSDLKGW